MPFCLTTPPTPTLFGVFAFQHRRSPFITGAWTPSIRCLYNSSLFIFTCIRKVFACCLHQEHKRLPVVHNFYTVSALSFIWENFFSLHLLSHYSTSLNHWYSCTIFVCPRVIFVLQILPIPCLCLTAAHPVITPVQVKIGRQSLSPYCIYLPFSGSSSILPLRNHSHRI